LTPSSRDARALNEKGSILLIVLILLLLITIIGMSAIDNSISEMRIARFDRLAKRNFYNAEAGLYDAVADFERIYTNSSDTGGNRLYPLTDTLPPLRDRELDTAGISFVSPVQANGIPVAWIEVRSVLLKANQKSAGLGTGAEQVPSMMHIGPAPEGFDENKYRSRHYAITATAIDPATYDATNPSAALTNVILQSGVVMAEETTKVKHLSDL